MAALRVAVVQKSLNVQERKIQAGILITRDTPRISSVGVSHDDCILAVLGIIQAFLSPSFCTEVSYVHWASLTSSLSTYISAGKFIWTVARFARDYA